MVRCGDDTFCFGDAHLVFAVEPLVTPEGRGLADVAVEQLEQRGVTIARVERSHSHVLSVAGSTREGWIEGRILSSRGWVFLINAPTEPEGSALADILDRKIAVIER